MPTAGGTGRGSPSPDTESCSPAARAFAAALAVAAVVLTVLARLARGPGARAGWGLSAAGTACLLVAAAATALRGQESLDLLLVAGFFAMIAGYFTLAVADARGRLTPPRAGFVLLAGFVAAAVLDSTGAGGIVLAATWAGLSRLLGGSVASPAERSPSTL